MKHLGSLQLTVLGSALLAAWVGWPVGRERAEPGPTAQEQQREALDRAEKSLAWADQECQDLIAPNLAALDEFFAHAKSGSPAFAGRVLGWRSKWSFVADKVPFTKGGRHAEFLRQAFAEHMFRTEDLTRAVEQAVRGYADSIAATENQMLVRLRQDLQDLPSASLPQFANQESLASAYQQSLDQASDRVGTAVQADVATLLVSIVAEEVLVQVAVRLGVSAGVLGVGAGSSWATLGVGLVVGVIVDQLITWVWDWWSDPRGNLAKELDSQLDRLHDMIVVGDGQSPGLNTRLAEFARQRAIVRRQAIQALIGPSPSPLP